MALKESEATGQWNKLSESDKKKWEEAIQKQLPQLTTDETYHVQHPMTATIGPPAGTDAGTGMNRRWPPSETGGTGAAPDVPEGSFHKLTEKFRWSLPFSFLKEGLEQGVRKFKGTAITVGKTNNKTPYTREELLRGARTLAGKPILHNHLETIQEAQGYLQGLRGDGSHFDPRTIPPLVRKNIEAMITRGDMSNGQVGDAEFEDDGVEYNGALTTPEAIAMADAGLILGPSIGAIPRNKNKETPQGIMFEDLSIITPPEKPADPDSSWKMMEKLYEMYHPVAVDLAAPVRAQRIAVVVEQRKRILGEMQGRVTRVKEQIALEVASNP